MSKQKIAYFVLTGLFCLAVLPGGVMNIVQPEILVDMAGVLGMPLYVMTLVGVWKLLGIVALIQPKFRTLKEWAYAGFFFDLTGASISHGAVGDTAGIAPPLVIVALMFGSYGMWRATRAPEA